MLTMTNVHTNHSIKFRGSKRDSSKPCVFMHEFWWAAERDFLKYNFFLFGPLPLDFQVLAIRASRRHWLPIEQCQNWSWYNKELETPTLSSKNRASKCSWAQQEWWQEDRMVKSPQHSWGEGAECWAQVQGVPLFSERGRQFRHIQTDVKATRSKQDMPSGGVPMGVAEETHKSPEVMIDPLKFLCLWLMLDVSVLG